MLEGTDKLLSEWNYWISELLKIYKLDVKYSKGVKNYNNLRLFLEFILNNNFLTKL